MYIAMLVIIALPPVLGRMTPVPGRPLMVTSSLAPSNGFCRGLPRIGTVFGPIRVNAPAASPAGV